MCICCCCSVRTLAYASAIISIVEAVLFGVVNILLICMSTCTIQPVDYFLSAGLDKFWSWYFYDEGACKRHYGNSYTAPDWISPDSFPLDNRRHETDVMANRIYQITYLSLHIAWIISAFVLMYGNARKRWGYFVPWILLCLCLLIMDIVISSFFVADMIDVTDLIENVTDVEDLIPMTWMLSLYLRGYAFWGTNVFELCVVLCAFCKIHRKRSKQARKQRREAVEAAARTTQVEMAQIAMDHQPTAAHYAEPSNVVYVEAPPYPPPPYHREPSPPPVPKEAPHEVRPFSYINPEFRPSDPHDLKGMRSHPSMEILESEVYVKKEDIHQNFSSQSHERDQIRDGGQQVYDPPFRGIPRHYDSLRNSNAQSQGLNVQRFSSVRGSVDGGHGRNNPAFDPRPSTDYDEPWDLKKGPTELDILKPLPRPNLKVSPPARATGSFDHSRQPYTNSSRPSPSYNTHYI